MKRLCSLAAISLMALSGCNQSTPATATANHVNQPEQAEIKSDSQPVSAHPAVFTPETHSAISSDEVPLLEQINRENVRVVASATPSIVRITATTTTDPHAQLFGDMPFQFHFGPGTPHGFRQSEPAYGSGVIISKDGYIVTNNHVVEDASSIEVQLQDQRTFEAKVVASDAGVDVAVIKISPTNLPALPWGDSDKVAVGEQVFAIGNPFNLDDSVSKGIISAKGRTLPDANTYEDFIQTDAAINPGNSGGALINIHGELIGINAAIASTSRGNMGVGFAIPSNLVRYAVEGLLRDGRLVRGYLGVRLPATIDEGVTAQLGLESNRGALLAGVQHNSPADQAKLHAVDFITAVDGHKIDSVAHLRLIVAQIPVGKRVAISYIRAGEAKSTTVTIAEAPKPVEQEPSKESEVAIEKNSDPVVPNPVPPSRPATVLSGLQVTDLNGKTRLEFGVDEMVTTGVVVTRVQEGSLADTRGLLRGDVIEMACTHRGSIQPLANPGEFAELTKNLRPSQKVVLLVHHGKASGMEDKSSGFLYLSPQMR